MVVSRRNELHRFGGLGRLAMVPLLLALCACQLPGGPATVEPADAARPGTSAMSPANAPKSVSTIALIGQSEEQIVEAFGEPRQVRRETPAEVWQYSSTNCVVDFYLYQGTSGGLAVSFVEARDSAALETEPDSCVATLPHRAIL